MVRSPGIVVVAGPTASGKSGLALKLAQEIDGELICSDSMHVYRQLDIGTSKPTLTEQKLVPHHQLDLIDPDENYSAGKYERETSRIIEQIQERGHVPILVGGTGLYYRALLYGISHIPDIPENIRKEVICLQEEHGTSFCWEQLQKLDPQASKRLHPNDTARIMRSLEVVLATGTSLSTFQQHQPFSTARYPFLAVAFEWERSVHYERINQRTLKMLESGWIAEVKMLLTRYSPKLKPLQAIGYREIVLHLQGKLEWNLLVQEIQQRTRQYAKRQLTWFRREAKIEWHQPDDEAAILSKIKVYLEKQVLYERK
ncbi:MAG TPA: tRNA (adenosine(37)-N6)-dimethylallyltransferase MiaA [Candidatus Lambdaproteobacteria bacterium]|nr:tRNA (adenosine(37)-N6)-dimethylallyltransferase MiaA [Candidatus Lambdaproteobacteria bacterium]HIO10271.1 tRNA (adenosine(37)-N6)-dimethylallyltransferase MiaA [Deltaproteobacteria bacterium]HIO62451.1 tRNA (adenosine(37)-N6)-dimethylallyltransferase MiaA [Deltaproteobacteria bacterium]